MNDLTYNFDENDLLEQIAGIEHLCFNYDEFALTLKRIQQFYKLSQYSDTTSLMTLCGETGVGKTTIIECFCKWVQDTAPHKKVRGEILSMSVPANATPKALASDMLVKLGDPAADKGSTMSMTDRIIHYIKELDIPMVIFDEFQHLVETKSDKVQYATADWLKSLLNETSCPFLLAGLPSLQNVFDANGQLQRRLIGQTSLNPMSIATPQSFEKFQLVLAMFAEQMPFDDAEYIYSETWAKALHVASGGAIGRVAKILIKTCLNALEHGDIKLKKVHFEHAVHELARDLEKGTLAPVYNPYSVEKEYKQ
ncbi:ATP-binding protein [Kordiimonas sp. SCSIO 12610]|uniref:ATP-binding protein n=1 Tax=Kordiimonas sp. SCSIO 12610 TaxID=2829597 RepID=UPI00210CFC9C|nr:ATP-binding protein [Kordiimonas sp. SCSIO 12610]UTW54821.1 TniB family NTP-binding protein [Kordiimonas sp. SCSIO 12610]